MKTQSVTHNNRKRAFEVKASKKTFLLPYSNLLPYSKVEPRPSVTDPIARLFVGRELGREGFSYVLASGKEAPSMSNKCWSTIRAQAIYGTRCSIS